MTHAARGSVRPHDEDGFTLIELVMAMVCLTAMALAVIGIIVNSQAQSISNRNRIAAANLAAREIDLVREQFAATDSGPVDLANAGFQVNPNHLPGGTDGQPLVVDGVPYTVKRSVEWNITGTGASACEGGSLVSYPSLGVTVSVEWPNMGQVKPVVNSAAFAPDKDTGVSTTDSFIASKVLDQDGLPLPNIPVSAGGSTAYTDATGCAVVRVTPAVTTGTSYTVMVADATYVDLSGTVNPTKSTGTLQRGRIYSGASFAVGKAGSVTLRLVRADGQALTNAQVNGSTVTLVASQFSGANGRTTRVMSGVTSTFTGLYPTSYGAYFGTTAPSGGYTVTKLTPGGSLNVDVVFEMAHITAANLPAGATQVVAVPAGTVVSATTCSAATIRGTAAAGTAELDALPGSYDLYVTGPTFACSPGPAAQAYTSGDNPDTTWAATQLKVNSVPGATLVAVDQNLSGVMNLTTCPTGLSPAIVRNIDGARSGFVDLPAGTYYIWQVSGSTCAGYPVGLGAFSVPYGQQTTKTWALGSVTLQVTEIPSSRQLVLNAGAAVTSCTGTATTPATPTYTSSSTTSGNVTLTWSAPRPASTAVTYYAYIWQKGSSPKCTSIGTFVVGPSTGALLTKSVSSALPTDVKGP
jgi:type II secretory pathway pseudopilin PulG